MSKFCASKRLNEASIRELDSKIQMESFTREKKEAILQDRKMEMIQNSVERKEKHDED